jgi:NAD(P)-dependent dehydrogenase (short-subunit alcohol dehydrogenase family)
VNAWFNYLGIKYGRNLMEKNGLQEIEGLKVAIVTGGGNGIGQAISLRLASEGYHIALNYFANREPADETAEKIHSIGRRSLVVQGNLCDTCDIHKFYQETLDVFGQVNLLVNNAGGGIHVPFLEITEEQWDRMHGVNLKAVFILSQLVAQQMINQGYGGKIINIGSTGGQVAIKGLAHYCAAKGGLTQLTKAMATELAPLGIIVNEVAPGTILAGSSLPSLEDEEIYQEHVKLFPVGRFGTSEDVAAAVSFLASEESGFIVGATIPVDGGCLIWRH